MTLLIGALTLGLILALLALGVYVSFRIFNIPDMTAEGSVTLGASVAAAMMVGGHNAVLATAAGHCRWNGRRRRYRAAGHQVQNQRTAQRHPGHDRPL